MTLLNASLAIADGGLGILAAGQLPVAVVGCSSAGTAATPTEVDTLAGLVATFGRGPLVEAAAQVLSLAGGPVYCVRAATDAAGSKSSAVGIGTGSASPGSATANGSNTSSAVPALGGTPVDAYRVRITVVAGGSNIAANPTVKVSLDGGLSYLATAVAVASATAIGDTGLTISWTDGTFVAADYWTASATPAAVTGTSTPAITGTPVDAYDVRMKVATAGASLTALTAEVQFSLDGGANYSPRISVPSSGVVDIPDTGLTVTWGAGTFVAGEVFVFRTSAPVPSGAGITAALTSLATVAGQYEFALVATPCDSTNAALLKTWSVAREAAGEYVFALTMARDQIVGESLTVWASALNTEMASFDGGRHVDMCATHERVVLYDRQTYTPRRSLAPLRAARLASIPAGQHPGRVKTGPIAGIAASVLSLAQDQSTYTSLDAHRFSGAQSVPGQPRGSFFFTSRTMAASTSDFSEIQRVRVICKAARAGLTAISQYVADDIRVRSDGTGRIDPVAAAAIDAEVTAAVRRAVVDSPNDFATSASATVTRTNNLVSTGQLLVTIEVVPKGYANTVTATLSFSLA